MKSSLISILPAGYGHYKVTIEYTDGKLYNAVTNNNRAIDSFNTDVFLVKHQVEKNRAEKWLIRFVKDQNNLK